MESRNVWGALRIAADIRPERVPHGGVFVDLQVTRIAASVRETDGERIGGCRNVSRVNEGVASERKLESKRSGTTAEPIPCANAEC